MHLLILRMGTNTGNGIQIFGTAIQINSNIPFWEIVSLSVPEVVSPSGHLTYLDTGTLHDQFEVRKVQSGVSINYLELGSLYMLNCFLSTCNSRRRPSICKFKFRSVHVICETRCQHESIDSIVKTESNSNQTICGEA